MKKIKKQQLNPNLYEVTVLGGKKLPFRLEFVCGCTTIKHLQGGRKYIAAEINRIYNRKCSGCNYKSFLERHARWVASGGPQRLARGRKNAL